MQAHLQTSHGLGSHLDTSSAEDQASPATTEATPVAEAQPWRRCASTARS
jgi:hypothetical protein